MTNVSSGSNAPALELVLSRSSGYVAPERRRTHSRAGAWEQGQTPCQMSLGQMHTALKLSHWDIKLMKRFMAELKLQLPGVSHGIQKLWATVLGNVWKNHNPTDKTQDIAFELGVLAGAMHHWTLAIEFFQASLECTGEQSAARYNLAIAYWQLAIHRQALWHLTIAVELDPGNALCRRKLNELKAWDSYCHSILGADFFRPASRSGEKIVSASLLGHHHAVALHRRLSSPVVARMARIEQSNSVAEARRWIKREIKARNKTTLAILHPHYGLIGSVALERAGEAAWFYYWIGAEFQNQGYGSQALELLCQFARQNGVSWLYSPVYNNNHRSLRVLRKAGFINLPHPSDPADEPQQFFHLPLHPNHSQASEHDALARLQRLLESIHAPA
jgi:GNAT superfamily N-acetyltransferase